MRSNVAIHIRRVAHIDDPKAVRSDAGDRRGAQGAQPSVEGGTEIADSQRPKASQMIPSLDPSAGGIPVQRLPAEA